MGENTLKTYDRAARFYDSEPNSVLFTETGAVLALLGLAAGDRLLDAACGTGKYLAEAEKAGAAAAGLDFSQEMLARAEAKCPGARFARHDLERPPLPFPDGEFTHVVFAHGLRHIVAGEALFAEFARLLRPGGALVVTITHPDARFGEFRYKKDHLDPEEDLDLSGEKRAYTRDEIIRIAAEAGLAAEGGTDIAVDERLQSVLTEDSFAAVSGSPLILVLRFRKK